MKIPGFLVAAYNSDLKLAGFVSQALERTESHISANRMVFFPEYTDHSVRHIELTQQTAFDLATLPARGLMTPIDAAALVVAVSLHDVGTHLTKDGFQSLIARDSRWKGIEFFDRKDWRTLWDDFYAEASRFDGRKLRELFGENYRPVRPLPSKQSSWEDFDYLLVGEFLRKHHARLAHEISLYGLPSKDGKAIELCPVDSEDQLFLADVSGLIARSHGIDLRKCLDYLEYKYKNKIDPRRTHPAFLGVLLRIADYFQIQASRAPTARTDVDTFQSELSDREWTLHQCIKDIHNTGGDPEAIVIVAEPKDVGTFLKLKDWLTGLQYELDQSWAILGEIYGLQSHNNLNLLGLKIRRIKSNVDDVPEFAKTVFYVPAKISFEAANADLLKLLIAPLYGEDNPGTGIRELFQNAIDAVREFDDLAVQHPELVNVDRLKQDCDVSLQIICSDNDDEQIAEIVVTDRGVGMTAEIIRDYFLKAGASFRRSSAWREEHEDESGHSRVFRTGRFGVGALAAFLLGDEIEVTTRHVFADSLDGIQFTAKLDDPSISLNRVPFSVGTRIRIKVPNRMRETVSQLLPFSWQKEISYTDNIGHYFLKRPSLCRHISGRDDLPIRGWLPQPEDDASPHWRCFANSEFQKVFWTYKRGYPNVSCNGIVIVNRDSTEHWEIISRPNISIFDKEGRFPVNLQRTEVQGELPFKEDLLKSITEDLIAHAILEAPAECDDPWFAGVYEGFTEQDRRLYMSDWSRWLISKNSFALYDKDIMDAVQPKSMLLALGGEIGFQWWGEKVRGALPSSMWMASTLPSVFSDNNSRIKGIVQRLITGRFSPPNESRGLWELSSPYKTTIFVPSIVLTKARNLRPGRQMQADLNLLEASEERNGWKFMTTGGAAPSLVETICEIEIDKRNAIAFCAIEINNAPKNKKPGPVARRWMDVCGEVTIPLDKDQRRRIQAHASNSISKSFELRAENSIGDTEIRDDEEELEL